MAKIRTGSLAGNIRGSIGSDTWSQNRYGTYIRKRAIPTIVNTIYTQKIRSSFAACSMLWQGLTEDQREQWRTWAQSNPVRDKFGELQVLSGNVAFIKLNTRLVYNDMDVNISPPGKMAPPAINTIAISEMTETTFKINTEPDILDEDERLIIDCYVSDSPSLKFYKNRLRQIACIKKETSDAVNIKPYIEAKYGALIKDNYVYIRAYVMDKTNGQVSVPYYQGFKYTYT